LPITSGVRAESLSRLGSPSIVQLGWVVSDLAQAAAHWAALMGAGPFFRLPHVQLDDLTYRGSPADWDHSSAVGQWGPIQLELMEQHCSSPSGIRDVYRPGESGVHHVTWVVEDFEKERHRLESMGFPAVMTGRVALADGMQMGWFDTLHVLGVMAEVYQESESMRRSFSWVARQADGWDGRDVLRDL
jgi:hypothetical protein